MLCSAISVVILWSTGLLCSLGINLWLFEQHFSLGSNQVNTILNWLFGRPWYTHFIILIRISDKDIIRWCLLLDWLSDPAWTIFCVFFEFKCRALRHLDVFIACFVRFIADWWIWYQWLWNRLIRLSTTFVVLLVVFHNSATFALELAMTFRTLALFNSLSTKFERLCLRVNGYPSLILIPMNGNPTWTLRSVLVRTCQVRVSFRALPPRIMVALILLIIYLVILLQNMEISLRSFLIRNDSISGIVLLWPLIYCLDYHVVWRWESDVL